MSEVILTPKQRQALKARAHSLKPVVLLGSAGLSAAVLQEIDRALTAHELIKVRVPADDRAERDDVFATVADSLSAARVQSIGKLLVLYRPAPDAPQQPAPPRIDAGRGVSMQRSKKAPAKGSARPPRTPAAQQPATVKPERRDVERLQRGTAPRRDPGAAHRAGGRSNAPKGRRAR
jgi:RNA-binding protein